MRRIGETKFAVLILRQLADKIGIPPDVKLAHHGVTGARGGAVLKAAAQRLQNLKHLADLCRGLARLQIDDETQADTGRTSKLILPQTSGLAGGPYNLADFCSATWGRSLPGSC